MKNTESVRYKQFRQDGGNCFRWCFQWVSGKVRNVSFDLKKIKKNADTIIQADQKNYLNEANSVRTDPRLTYGKWVASAHSCDIKYINDWGARYTKHLKCDNSSAISSFGDYFRANGTGNHLILFIYGEIPVELGDGNTLKGKSDYWGHAMAFAPTPLFFDPNNGEWIFDPKEDIGLAIDNHCHEKYVRGIPGKTIVNKYVCPIIQETNSKSG